VTSEIARLLREIAYELIAIAIPGVVSLAGVLVLLHHLSHDQAWLMDLAERQAWLFVVFAFAAAYASGQIAQATGHVAIYWLKLPWAVALLALAGLERVPGIRWLKEKRYFRLLDVPNDRREVEEFQKTALFKRARHILALQSDLPDDDIAFFSARDLALAALGQDAAERHKFLNLSEFCIGMAGAHLVLGAVVIIESVNQHHEHGAVIATLFAAGSIFMLRQPRYFAISEKVAFGQLLIKYGHPAAMAHHEEMKS